MSTDTPCITWYDWPELSRADRSRPCVRRGQHYAACEDPDTCRGCVPRTASFGFLCVVCWEKLHDALRRVGWLIAHLRSIDTNGTNPGEKVDRSQERSILIPDSWLAADSLMGALGSKAIPSTASIEDAVELAQAAVAGWADAQGIVSTTPGALHAVILVRRMQTALHRWPDAEVEVKRVPQMLCPGGCGHRTLVRRAPLEYLDDMFIECETCDYRREYFDWLDAYEDVLHGVLDQQDRAEGRKPRARRRPAVKTSEPCDIGTHIACRNLSCTCPCHARTRSLYTNPVPFHLRKEIA